MENWQACMYDYFVIGALFASVIAIGAWVQTSREGRFARNLMAALDEQNRGYWY